MSWPSAAFSLGFGALDMNSFIGEPLDARVMLESVSAIEQGSPQMRMADAAAYERAGLRRGAAIGMIRLDIIDAHTQDGALQCSYPRHSRFARSCLSR